jgi:SAM-dependent methyltransferase
MKQNKYDDPLFFEKYGKMARSVGGLEAAGEWPAFRSLLPDMKNKRVLDLGCGFGWHCRYARESGAQHILGIDLSKNMLERARALTDDVSLEYRQSAIEDLQFAPGQFDAVISSLALHYVEYFDAVCQNVFRWLTERGTFVFSVEHPVFTSRAAQYWHLGPSGERLHWPVDDYYEEGIRHTHWLADDVVKYHRTVTSYVNGLIESGFQIAKIEEPTFTRESVEGHPESVDERRRPMFLLLSAVKSGVSGDEFESFQQ